MIPKLGLQALQKSYNESLVAEEISRSQNTKKLIDYYNGDQIDYIKKNLQFKVRKVLWRMNNITYKIIKKKSMVYKQFPKRFIGGETNDKYNALTKNKNEFLKEGEKQANLLGIIGCKIEFDEVFKYQMIREFTCFFNDADLLKPYAVKYPISQKGQTIVYEYWDEENHYFMDNKMMPLDPTVFGWEDNINPYGFIPIVWLRNRYLIDDFYNTAGNADDIVNANEVLNVNLTAAVDKFKFQSFKNNYVSGADLEDTQAFFDYDSILNLTDPEATVGQLGNDHNFTIDSEWIKFQQQAAERSRNLSENWGMSGNTSGFQLIVENLDNQNDVEDMIDICRGWEQSIFEMEQKISNIKFKDLRVDFTEIKMPISQEEKLRKWQFEFDNGLKTRADYWKAENPDITEEEIEMKYKLLIEQASKEKEIKEQSETTIGSIFGE